MRFRVRREALAACDVMLLPCWRDGSLVTQVEPAAMPTPVICVLIWVDGHEAPALIRDCREVFHVPAATPHPLQLVVLPVVPQHSFMLEVSQGLHEVGAYYLLDSLHAIRSVCQFKLRLSE